MCRMFLRLMGLYRPVSDDSHTTPAMAARAYLDHRPGNKLNAAGAATGTKQKPRRGDDKSATLAAIAAQSEMAAAVAAGGEVLEAAEVCRGRIVTLHRRAFTSYQIRECIRYLRC
jgi:hypothetical protein